MGTRHQLRDIHCDLIPLLHHEPVDESVWRWIGREIGRWLVDTGVGVLVDMVVGRYTDRLGTLAKLDRYISININ